MARTFQHWLLLAFLGTALLPSPCIALAVSTGSGLSPNGVQRQVPNPANDWLAATSATNNSSEWFDLNGNQRTNGANVYLYDWANRLTNAVVGGVSISIWYDADGNRVKKVVGTTTNLYLVAAVNPTGYPQVLEESTVSGSTTNLATVYTYGLSLILQRRISGGTLSFYGFDGLGSTRFLTDGTANITDTYAFDAFGNLIASSGGTANNYLYAGQQWDPDLGLYYLRARYYNPNAGRFLSGDTFEGSQTDPLSLHKYLYCADNPVNRMDPTGHEVEELEAVELGEEHLDSADALIASVVKREAQKMLAKSLARATLALVPALLLGGDDASQTIAFQTDQQLNSTKSSHAYQKYVCDQFAADALAFFFKLGKHPQRITYDSFHGRTYRDLIAAAPGFGFFGSQNGQTISVNGHHEGVLVDGSVFDNNVPFGVPRSLWENGYEINPIDNIGHYLTLRQAHDQRYGLIESP